MAISGKETIQIGLQNESIYLFKVLKNNNQLTTIYKNAVENNLKNLNSKK